MGLGRLFQEVKAAQAEGQWLIPLLMERLCVTEERSISPDMWLSPSVLADFCPRAWAISYKLGLPLVDERRPDNMWWMDGGTALHTMLQDQWFGPTGVLHGGWKCTECGYTVGLDPDDDTPVFSHGDDVQAKVTVESAVPQPQEGCPECGMKPSWRRGWTYVEPTLYDTELKVAGLCDGIIVRPGQPPEVIDFKCIVDNIRWVKKSPRESAVKQVHWYMDMAGLRRGRVFYLDRAKKNLADGLVEHPLRFDEALMEQQKEIVRAFRSSLEEAESSIPDCPNGGSRPWGPCDCAGLEGLWAAHGA